MEGALQSCISFVQSKGKELSKAVHWKKTGVDSRSYTPSKDRFPKNVWKR